MSGAIGTAALRLGAALAAFAAAGTSLHGQAVCSAPHSAPILTSAGSIGTLPPGSGWVQFNVYRVRSDRFFGPSGISQPFIADARALTTSAIATAAVGLIPGVEAWAQLPVHSLDYRDESGDLSRTGLGDPRISVRVDASVLGLDAPVSLRAGLKLAASEFPVDARILPLTEGQADREVALETGHAFGSVPAYLIGWVGYRWRGTNDRIGRKPGDERFAHVAVGGSMKAVRWELAIEALSGLTPQQAGFGVPSSRRRLVQLNPTVGLDLGPGVLEAGGQVPVSGRNLPTGAGLGLGYRIGWTR